MPAISKGHFKNWIIAQDGGFYTARPQLLELADVLESFINNGKRGDVLNVSLPARFGKSRIATDLSAWLLVTDRQRRILRASYSAELAETFSEQVKNKVNEIFAGTPLEASGTRSRWKIGKMQMPNHVGTGISGTITGFGCDIAIIDDTAKNMLEATSAAYRKQLEVFRETVLLSRLEGMSKIINVGTRWTVNDWFSYWPTAERYVVAAMTPDGESCCEAWKTTAELQAIKESVRPYVWDAQYMQQPTATGRVRIFEGWQPLRLQAPDGRHFIIIDPATEFGRDYFVAGDYVVSDGHIWLVDMLASQRLELPTVAAWLGKRAYSVAYCEANGIGRNVINELQKLGVCNLAGFATKSDKYSRAVLKAEALRHYFRIDPQCEPSAVAELIRQADEFPVGEHDDLIDNVVMAFERLLD